MTKNTFLLCYDVRMLFLAFLGPDLKVDQALLTIHNQLTEDVQVFYTTDYCFKVKIAYISSLIYLFMYLLIYLKYKICI